MQRYMSNIRKKIPYFIIVLFVGILQMTANAVTVRANAGTAKPTELLLEKSEMVCRAGDELCLTEDEIETIPEDANKSMNWETSDATIVEVDDSCNGTSYCRMTAKKIGTAVLTGTSATDENIKVQCTIHVMDGQYSSSGNWVLDKNGNLTMIDNEDIEKGYRNKVKKAKVIITKKCNSLYGLLENCTKLTQVEFVVRNSSNVDSMQDMFKGCKSLKTVDISKLDTSNVVNVSGMFGASNIKTVNMSGLNLSKVKELSYVFRDCTNLESVDMSNLNAPNVEKVAYMFEGCKKLKKVNMSGANFSKVTDITTIFDVEGIALETVNMSKMDLSSAKSLSYMFDKCLKLKTVNMKQLQIPNVTDMSWMMYANLFQTLEKLTTVDMRGVYAPKLKTTRAMFIGCTGLKNVYFDDMKALNIQNTNLMFSACKSLKTIDVSSLGFKNAILDSMFVNCSSLKKVNLNTIHKSTVKSMGMIFGGCTSLKNVYMDNLDVSKATSMVYMFSGCSSLEVLDLSSWNTSKVKSMGYMFWNCTNLKKLDLGCFDTSKVSSMQQMFYGCSKLEQLNIENFTLSTKLASEIQGGYILGVGDMFTGCNSLKYIKTPKNVQLDVRLPYEMYTSNGSGCAMLPRHGSTVLSINGYKPAKAKVKKLSMNKSSVKMKVGEKIILYASTSPVNASKSVKWKSSNKKIATVDSKGNIKAKKAGSVTITATSKSNKKLTAKCKITVYSKIKSVKLSATKNTLVVGGKLSLKTTASPKTAEKKFWYRSSNPAVAQVDANGKVVANNEGVTTITVISMENKKVTAKYVITVKSKVASGVSKGVNITPTLMPNTPEVPVSVDAISPEVPSGKEMTISTEVPLAKKKYEIYCN